MHAQKRLSLKEKQEALIRKSDFLREECGEIWAEADYRAAKVEERVVRRIFVSPVVPEILGTGLSLLQARLGLRYRKFSPLFSIVEALLVAGRRKFGPEPTRPVQPTRKKPEATDIRSRVSLKEPV